MATTRRKATPEPPPQIVLFKVATETLYVGTEGRAVAAFQPGDKVPFDLIEPNGWTDKVEDFGTPAADDANPDDDGDVNPQTVAPTDQAVTGQDEGASE